MPPLARLCIRLLVTLIAALPLFASSNDAGWRTDIQYLTTELPKRHKNAFFHTPRAAFDSAGAALLADLPSLNDAEVAVRVQQLVAMVGDGHTTITGWRFASYPLRLYWFDDGLFVTSATSEQADLVGARVVAIDGHDAAEVLERAGTVFAHENEAWLRSLAPAQVVTAEVLYGLHIANEPSAATFTLERDGVTFDRRIEAGVASGAEWIEIPPTLRRRNPQRNYWAEYLAPQRTLYLKYNRCVNDPAKPFTRFLDEMLASTGGQPVDRFLIDLRDNGGGDSSVLQPLISGLQSMPALNRADRAFVLIGRATFSSALINAIQLNQQTNATLVGEPTGGKPNSYGEILTFRLPASGLTVWYSTKFFELLRGQDPASLEPEVAVPTLATTYFAGGDAALELLLPKIIRRRAATH